MVVDGVELLIMAKNNEIKNRTKIKNVNYDKYYEYRNRTFWAEPYNIGEEMAFSEILENQFIILSEGRKKDKKINIQAMKELDLYAGYKSNVDKEIIGNRTKINELIKAVKQLDKNKVDK